MLKNQKCESPKINSEANIRIAIKGLAMCNYNKNNQNWEAIFLRHVANHNLKIIINKCRGETSQESQTYEIEPNEKIYVRSSNAVAPDSPRYDGDDEKSLSRVIDFADAEMHEGRLAFEKGLDLPKTFLSISDSVFYTKTLSKNVYDVVKNDGETIKTTEIGLVIGADIVCRAGGKTEILVAGKPNLIAPLVAEEGVVYEIVFDNDCYEPASHAEGDFKKYYDLISAPETFTLNLAVAGEDPPPTDPPPPPPEKNPPCNAVIVSELSDGLSSLAELLNG
ncbi:MAG: hypothetical protein M3033_19485 [Acidobacteriota bacterium]|nr:hypothetical protein [Acidobacteriota bacterium]